MVDARIDEGGEEGWGRVRYELRCAKGEMGKWGNGKKGTLIRKSQRRGGGKKERKKNIWSYVQLANYSCRLQSFQWP